MSDTVIRVEKLGKKYIIGHQQENQRYTALRDVIASGAKEVVGRFRGKKHQKMDATSEEFWALKDVSFEVKKGDRVGIIGRNGAGKSTLLKILSRITEPTEGRISIKGRVASLLEVGTGFHPELTGRENIYLNGAILGMSKAEIRRKFDEIVDFAEIEKFLDTPVKRYSSGMYVRLAFAVAANLEPEILVVDEVLAVGDAQFQKKCLGKMEDVTKEGRTILFVSHNMMAMKMLCPKSIMVDRGKIVSIDSTNRIVERYLSGYENNDCPKENLYDPPLSFAKIEGGNHSSLICSGESILISFGLNEKIADLRFIVGLYRDGLIVSDLDYSRQPLGRTTPCNRVQINIKNISLTPGLYSLNLLLLSGSKTINHYPGCLTFEIMEGVYSGRVIRKNSRGYCSLESDAKVFEELKLLVG